MFQLGCERYCEIFGAGPGLLHPTIVNLSPVPNGLSLCNSIGAMNTMADWTPQSSPTLVHLILESSYHYLHSNPLAPTVSCLSLPSPVSTKSRQPPTIASHHLLLSSTSLVITTVFRFGRRGRDIFCRPSRFSALGSWSSGPYHAPGPLGTLVFYLPNGGERATGAAGFGLRVMGTPGRPKFVITWIV